MRSLASSRRSARAPNWSAPDGQTSVHAGTRPFAWRSAQNVHFLTSGVALENSYFRSEEVGARAELERARRADLRARGHEALRLALRAERALLDERRRTRKFVLRDAKGARDHAVAAAEAAVLVVDDRPGRGFLECLDDAAGGAGRLNAVHALSLGEAVLAGGALQGAFLDDGVGRRARRALRREHGVVAGLFGAGEGVCLRAGRLAGAAADTARRVHENAAGVACRWHDRSARRRGRPCDPCGAGRCCELEESAAIQVHRGAPSDPGRAGRGAVVEEQEENEQEHEGNRGDHGTSLREPSAATAGDSAYATSVPSRLTAS